MLKNIPKGITREKEALRYLENAKELLSKSTIETNVYADVKYVRLACGAAYLAILKAIDEYLTDRGVDRKGLPKSVDDYRKALKRYLSVHNGKLCTSFEALYDELHIAGYYRGLLRNVNVVKEIFKVAKVFIEKIGR